jgi:nitrogen fixation/metabolism regulation signal transduction histidine kinase
LQSGEAKTITLNGATTFKVQKSHFIDRGFPRHFITIEELTAEILAAEKKAYGKVIRMMAHEVNNTIGPVNSILQSALKEEALWKDGNKQALQNALQVAMDRNKNLNMFMRNFADVVRLPEPKRKKIDLHKLIYSVAKLMELKAEGKQIQFQYQLTGLPFYIIADEQQMEQALINIVKNAIEAIEEKGTITFTATDHPSQLIISDTGKGIDASLKEQIFSPFFSTKKDGQGVGLMIIKEIFLNHNFKFSLNTIKAGITDFVITFE